MAKLPPASWWEIRTAQNRKPSTYTCPLCGGKLPSLVPHALISPEGDRSRRRHAHTACVARARGQGRLPSLDEHRRAIRAQSGHEPWWRRLLSRASR